MDLSKILSISGKSGLFKVVTQAKNAVIVESLIDNKRFPAFGHEKISSLEEISVFTTGEDMPLKEVFKAFFEKLGDKPAIDPKSDNKALKQFFLEMIPEYDQERVYVSDIKKMFNWYNQLLAHKLLDFTEKEEEKPEEKLEEKPEEPVAEQKEAEAEIEVQPETPAQKKRSKKEEQKPMP